MHRLMILLSALAIACAPPAASNRNNGGNGAERQDAGPTPPPTDAGNAQGNDAGTTPPNPSDRLEPGSACSCSNECFGTDINPGICVLGVCMQEASAECGSAGSTAECDRGSRCWGMDGLDGSICWPDCDAFSCAGECDSDGSCVPSEATAANCNNTCSDYCGSGGGGGGNACDDVTCPEGQLCDPNSGECIETDQDLPAGPPPNCTEEIPSLEDCNQSGASAPCKQLMKFSPDREYGYWDYPLNGEGYDNRDTHYRSWLSRDLMLLVRRATATTQCLSRGWDYQAYMDLGLGDMSEEDGSIPGTSDGQPGHPAGTHVNGRDIDIAYYQVNQPNNWLRSVCEHVQGGEDQYHCVETPAILDIYRTALFIGALHDNPRLRVIGVDGKVGPLVASAITQLCAAGWLTNSSCRQVKMTYEVTDSGRGWYRFHHHHLHVSLSE